MQGTDAFSEPNVPLQSLLKFLADVRSLMGYPPTKEPVDGSSLINENPILNSKLMVPLMNPDNLSLRLKVEARA
jgi:hypothetical protein